MGMKGNGVKIKFLVIFGLMLCAASLLGESFPLAPVGGRENPVFGEVQCEFCAIGQEGVGKMRGNSLVSALSCVALAGTAPTRIACDGDSPFENRRSK